MEMQVKTNIIEKLSKNPEIITEESIKDWVVPELLEHFAPKLASISYKVYGYQNGSSLGIRAFTEMSRDVLEKATTTFYITREHWKNNRYVTPYLITCLNRLGDKTLYDLQSSKTRRSPICPGCLFFDEKTYLNYSGKNFSCSRCNNEQIKLQDLLSACVDVKEKTRLECQIRIRSVFGNHSRRGFACPECKKFIPESYFGNKTRVSCPYDTVCGWFGNINDLRKELHPVGNVVKRELSLNFYGDKSSGDTQTKNGVDLVKSNELSIDSSIIMRESFENDIKILDSVLLTQGARYKDEKSIKKKLMYEAFINIRKKYPEDMVWYLVHQNRVGDSPIQSRIFQEYILLVQNALPFSVRYDGKMHDIYSLQDPRLDLFTGTSEFEAIVKTNGIVPNGTKEEYVGGRSGLSRGPCFIGHLLSITDKCGNSLMDCVDSYTFANIKLNNVEPGTSVTVKHLRIPAHYEMNGLIFLQRIRRKIVDSVYQRVNGKRRQVGGENV